MEQVSLYNETLSHCTAEFSPIVLGGLKINPIVLHFTEENANKHAAQLDHQHCFAELSWMIKGSMGYKIDNKMQIISTKAKNFIFVPQETTHMRIMQDNNTNILGFLLDMTPQNETGKLFFDEIVKFLAEHNYTFDNLIFLNEFENKLLEELNSGVSVFIEKINFCIYEFLFKLFSHYFSSYLIKFSNTRKMSHDRCAIYDRDTLVVSVKQNIEQCLASPIRLSLLAQNHKVSVRHLNRVFSEQTGCSIGNYIIQRKLNAAQKMLLNPMFSIKEIADSLGFQRDSYFCHFFKKNTGMTAVEYAKKVNKS